jgi:alpha-tubulin suppressor-like RCC1 family protein
VRCWGHGYYGDIGNGKNSEAPMPTVYGAGPASDVAAGYYFTCAVLSNGEVACAGMNDSNQLGRGGGNSNVPLNVIKSGSLPDGGVADGGGSDGGAPSDGGVADGGGSDAGGADAGVPVVYLSGATKVATGGSHACAMVGTSVQCWGSSDNGESGTSTSPTQPFTVPLGAPALDVAAGGAFTCAVLQDGSVRCWGYNGYGQLGTGGSSGSTLRTPPLGGKAMKSIVAGDDHVCALATDGTVLCWGRNHYGQIGNGLRIDSPAPVAVPNLGGVTALSAHGDTTCAVLQDGSVTCWGNNSDGQLGDGSELASGVPKPVVGY